MQTNNKFFDDMSKVMTNAMGVAQGAKEEAENAMKSWVDRWLADRDFVTRDEFDAVKAMAQKAREENGELLKRLGSLEAKKAPKSKKQLNPDVYFNNALFICGLISVVLYFGVLLILQTLGVFKNNCVQNLLEFCLKQNFADIILG